MKLRARTEPGANRAGPDKWDQEMPLGIGAELQAGLENLLFGGFGSERDDTGVIDRMGDGRFAIDVFTRFESSQCDFLVLMCRSGDDNRFDVLVIEDGFVIRGLNGRGSQGRSSAN